MKKINAVWAAAFALLLTVAFLSRANARTSSMDITAERVFSASSAVAGDVFIPRRINTESIAQFEITGTATLYIKGRVSSDAPWVILASRSTSGGVVVPAFPEMIVECTAYTSGNVKAWFAVGSN